jgi:hypothetical protein
LASSGDPLAPGTAVQAKGLTPALRKLFSSADTSLPKIHEMAKPEKWKVWLLEKLPDCSKTVVVGEMAEWLKAPVLKTGIRETVSGVRIPLSPP